MGRFFPMQPFHHQRHSTHPHPVMQSEHSVLAIQAMGQSVGKIRKFGGSSAQPRRGSYHMISCHGSEGHWQLVHGPTWVGHHCRSVRSVHRTYSYSTFQMKPLKIGAKTIDPSSDPNPHLQYKPLFELKYSRVLSFRSRSPGLKEYPPRPPVHALRWWD